MSKEYAVLVEKYEGPGDTYEHAISIGPAPEVLPYDGDENRDVVFYQVVRLNGNEERIRSDFRNLSGLVVAKKPGEVKGNTVTRNTMSSQRIVKTSLTKFFNKMGVEMKENSWLTEP
ncbi:MAG: hypothetical protein ABH817_02290 [archaeon]